MSLPASALSLPLRVEVATPPLESAFLMEHGEDRMAAAFGAESKKLDEIAKRCNAHDALLALARLYASECAECRGKGVVGISNYDGHGSDADDQPCEECADIRAVIAKAVTP